MAIIISISVTLQHAALSAASSDLSEALPSLPTSRQPTHSFIQFCHCLFALVHCIVDVFLVSVHRLGNEVEAELVNRKVVLPGVVLQGASQEPCNREERVHDSRL